MPISTTTARRRRIAETQEFESPSKPEPTPEPTITSGQQLRIQAVKELSGSVEQYKEIDPDATYVYESGEQILGRELRQRMAGDIKQYLLDTTRIKPGKYIEKEGQYYRTSDELVYLLYHAEPPGQRALIESMGKTGREGLPSDFVGPIKPPFISASEKAYESLVPAEKEEYGYRFQPFKEEPVETWQHHFGGKRYIESLSPKQQEQLLADYMGSESWTRYIESTKGVKERQATAMSIQELQVREPAILIPGWFNPFGGDIKQPQWMADLNISALAVYDYPAAERSIARKQIISDGGVFSTLGFRTRMGYSYAESILSATLFPVTLTQTAVKYVTGEGGYTDPFSRIKSGKTFLPDIGRVLAEGKITPTKGVLSGSIETIITGGKSDYLSTVMKYPWESGAASMGEFMGLYLGGKAIHVGKVGATRGLGYARSGIQKTTGIALPGYTQIMYYTPRRIFRRAWVKLGTKDIEKTMGIPYHSAETLTPGGLSFAPGKTIGTRITWTIGKTKATKGMPYSADDYLLASASGSRVGMRYTIKTQVLHELPALSTSPYGFAPTRFYRFTPSGLSYSSGTSLLPRLWKPTGFAIKLQKIFKPPKGSYEAIGGWAKGQPKGSWGVIGPKMYLGGPETEINIFGKTILKRFLPESKRLFHRFKGYEFYTKVPLEGSLKEVVPVVFTKAIHKGFPSGVKEILGFDITGKIKTAVFGSSFAGPTTSIISPGYLFASMIKYSIPDRYIDGFSIPSYPSEPSIPSFPSYPSYSYPSSPSEPSILSYPSKPSKPSIPSVPSISSYLSEFSIPSYPSALFYPSEPSIPSFPSYPSYSYPSSPSVPSPSSYPYPPIPWIPFYPSGESKIRGKRKAGYNVLVKERYIFGGVKKKAGDFIRVNKEPLSRKDALGLGGSAVDNSAAASFRIMSANAPAGSLGIRVKRWKRFQHKFYRKKDGTYVEKTTSRIDTPGEEAGISALGWIAQQKRIKTKVFKEVRQPMVNEVDNYVKEIYDSFMPLQRPSKKQLRNLLGF